MHRFVRVFGLAGLITLSAAYGQTAPAETDFALKLLKQKGAATYAEKANFKPGVPRLLLGYDPAGKAVAGVALRETATYKKVTTVVAVVPQPAGFKIEAAEIPDIEKLPGKSRDYARAALKDITDKVLPDAAAARGLVDAVSGATKYYQAIYISYSLMSGAVIEALNQNPEWPRQPIP